MTDAVSEKYNESFCSVNMAGTFLLIALIVANSTVRRYDVPVKTIDKNIIHVIDF